MLAAVLVLPAQGAAAAAPLPAPAPSVQVDGAPAVESPVIPVVGGHADDVTPEGGAAPEAGAGAASSPEPETVRESDLAPTPTPSPGSGSGSESESESVPVPGAADVGGADPPAVPAESGTPAGPSTDDGVSALLQPIAVLSHAERDTYDVGLATFYGSGTPRASVVAKNQWGVEMGRSPVGVNGRWAFSRNLGPTASSYQITFTQTLGADSDQAVVELFYSGVLELSVTSHFHGQLYTAGPTVFAGRGAPNALVTVVDTRLGEIARTTATLSGDWSAPAELVPTLDGHQLVVTQSRRDMTPQRVDLTLEYAAPVVGLAVDSHVDGQAYEPGVATFAGRGTIGSYVAAVNQWGTPMGSTRTGLDGTWSFARNLGPTSAGYEVSFTQTRGLFRDGAVVRLTVPALVDVVVTSPDVSGGTVADGDVMTTFRGTGTPYATLVGVNQWGTPFGETKVAGDGSWEFRRWLAVGTRYDLTFTQTSWTGEAIVTEGIGFDVARP